MTIAVTCACGKTLKAPDALGGKRAKCPQCGKVLTIPAAAAGQGNAGYELEDEPAAPRAPPAAIRAPTALRPATKPVRTSHAERFTNWFVKSVIVLLIVAAGWGGWRVYRYFDHQRRAVALVDTYEKNPERVAERIDEAVELLPVLVSNCNDRMSRETQIRTGHLHDRVLAAVITKLPETADIDCLLTVSPQCNASQPAARRVIGRRKSVHWIAQQALKGDAQVREMMTLTLRERLPLGDVGSDITSLGSSDAAALVEAITQRCRQALVGRYTLQMKTNWRVEELDGYEIKTTNDPNTLLLESAVVTVECDGPTWRVKLFDKTWEGTLDQLGAAVVRCSIIQTTTRVASLPHMDRVADRDVVLQVTPDGLNISGAGLITFVPADLQVVTGDQPAGASLLLYDFIGGVRITRYDDGVPTTTVRNYYFKPGSPGFETFEWTLIRLP